MRAHVEPCRGSCAVAHDLCSLFCLFLSILCLLFKQNYLHNPDIINKEVHVVFLFPQRDLSHQLRFKLTNNNVS